MARHATPSGSIEAARNRIVELVGSGQGARGAAFVCLVCNRPATWRIDRPLGSYTVCDWCASVIREYDAKHPEHDPSRHVRLPEPTPEPGTESTSRV
jgi:hypothetical protein